MSDIRISAGVDHPLGEDRLTPRFAFRDNSFYGIALHDGFHGRAVKHGDNMRFLNEGQLQGWKTWTPVQMAVHAGEEDDPEIQKLYETLFSTIERSSIGRGTGTVVPPVCAWEENDTHTWMILIKWQSDTKSFTLVVANFATHRSQCYAPLNVANIASHDWEMSDLLSDEKYQRSGEDLQSRGLFLDVGAYAAQCFNFTAVE